MLKYLKHDRLGGLTDSPQIPRKLRPFRRSKSLIRRFIGTIATRLQGSRSDDRLCTGAWGVDRLITEGKAKGDAALFA